MNLTGLPILDVAIGLAFFFFLLSIIASSVSEIIASLFRIRAKNLETGIRTLLGSKGAADSFFEHWRIKSLGTPKWRSKDKDEISRKPSYIPARTFSLAVLDTFSPQVGQRVTEGDPAQVRALDVLAELHTMVAKIDNDVAKKRLGDALDHARGNVDTFRLNLEDAFNDVMDRATGWYKRKVQIVLFFVALAIAGGLNADTLNVADRLARDDAVRAQVVAQAQAAVEAGKPEAQADPTTSDVEDQIEQARATALPLGWSGENVPGGKLGWVVLLKAAGILMTAVAMLLGAPFWFDTLGKFARLRSTGNRIGTPKDDETAPVDRDDRLRRSAPAGSSPPPPLSDAGPRGRG